MSGKVVVTGASGMLGGVVLRELRARGEDADGWSYTVTRAPDGVEFRPLDLRMIEPWTGDPLALEGARLVVNCAALTDADFCEAYPKEARQVNARGPGYLASAAAAAGARFVHISTDAVYDDTQLGRRNEKDRTRPGSVYAQTKLEGEGNVLAAYPDALVLRTTMFGWTLPTAPRQKLAEEILAALHARRTMRLFVDAVFSPLHVGDLAKAILTLAEGSASGVLNVGAHAPASKYGFGILLGQTFGYDVWRYLQPAHVDDLELPARRTKNVALDVREAEAILGPLPSIQDGVDRFYREAFDGTAAKLKGEPPLT